MPLRQQIQREFFKQRFWLSCFFSVTATGGWLIDKMTGAEYVMAITAILGLYGFAAWNEHHRGTQNDNRAD